MKHLILVFLLIFPSLALANPTALDIVKKADEFRGWRGQSFEFDLKTISKRPNKKSAINQLNIQIKGQKSLVKFEKPKRDKGKVILKEGNNLWFKIPRTRRVIRISPAQRLMGEVSNGDVASTDFQLDYDAKLVGEQLYKGKPSYFLELLGKNKKVAYHKIEYWVEKESGKPIVSKHYAVSGKLLKIAHYRAFKKFGDVEKLTELLLVNPINKGQYSLMTFDNYRLKNLKDALFRKENLNRL